MLQILFKNLYKMSEEENKRQKNKIIPVMNFRPRENGKIYILQRKRNYHRDKMVIYTKQRQVARVVPVRHAFARRTRQSTSF
jgi:hypothetical protein